MNAPVRLITSETAEVGDASSLMQFMDALRAANNIQRRRLFYEMFPDEDKPMPSWVKDLLDADDETTTIFAREKYRHHLAFFAAGKKYRERAILAGNRVGKTLSGGGYELAAHLTGEYPDWWVGRRFTRPINAWACGKTNETTRDILQKTLLGPLVELSNGKKAISGHGIIPGDKIGRISWSNFTDLVDTVKVQFKGGGFSNLSLKSFASGRGAFEGTSQHVILLDEEPPEDVYNECVIRTATTNGLVILTFTSLDGYTEVVLKFMPQADADEK